MGGRLFLEFRDFLGFRRIPWTLALPVLRTTTFNGPFGDLHARFEPSDVGNNVRRCSRGDKALKQVHL